MRFLLHFLLVPAGHLGHRNSSDHPLLHPDHLHATAKVRFGRFLEDHLGDHNLPISQALDYRCVPHPVHQFQRLLPERMEVATALTSADLSPSAPQAPCFAPPTSASALRSLPPRPSYLRRVLVGHLEPDDEPPPPPFLGAPICSRTLHHGVAAGSVASESTSSASLSKPA